MCQTLSRTLFRNLVVGESAPGETARPAPLVPEEPGSPFTSARTRPAACLSQRTCVVNFAPESSYAFSQTSLRKSGPSGAAQWKCWFVAEGPDSLAIF